jgi:hypothetical protein
MAGPWEKYKPAESNSGPWEQFKASTPEKGVQAPPPDPMMRLGLAAARGLFSGNPLMSIFGEGAKQTDEAVKGVAYKAGGAVTDLAAGNVEPETAAKLGFATNVGIQYLPSLLLGQASKSAGAPAMKTGARTLMQSALKPTMEQHRTGKAVKAIETMLKENVNVSKGGVEKMQKLIDQLGDDVAKEIAGSKAMVNKAKVGQELREVVEKFKNQVNPQSDLATIRKAWENFANHPLLKGKIEFPVQTAQALKQGSYRALGDKAYGMGLKPEAEREAQKALVRGLRKEIGSAVPAIEKPLAREAELINAAKVAQRRVLMDANKNPLGLGWLAQPWMMPFWMWDRSPIAKSLVARGLYQGAEQIPATAGQLGGVPLGMMMGAPEENR